MLFDPDQTVSPVAPAYCTVLQEFLESSSASYVRAEAVIDNLNRNTLGLPMFRSDLSAHFLLSRNILLRLGVFSAIPLRPS